MRGTALGFALAGGILGILFGLLAMAVGGIGNELEASSGNGTIGLGVSGVAAAVFGVVCGALYFGRWHERLMVSGILIAAVWHLVSISAFGALGFLFLLIAALLAWFGRTRIEREGNGEALTT